MLATKLDDSSLISRSHMVKKENQLLHVILQVLWYVQPHPLTHTK